MRVDAVVAGNGFDAHPAVSDSAHSMAPAERWNITSIHFAKSAVLPMVP
jgi:hypothetical protein